MTLFDLPQLPDTSSSDRRRTLHRQYMLDGGYHPVTKLPLADNGETCGTCDHLTVQGGTAGTYYKCGLRMTRGAATDTRLAWPACTGWDPQT